MSLLELMVALAILSLSTALAFSNLGPWLQSARTSADEAAFWRASVPAQMLLSELAAGAIDATTRQIAAREARFRTLAPRLTPHPIDVRLAVERGGDGWRLVMTSADLDADPHVLIDAAPELRFVTSEEGTDALTLEFASSHGWTALASVSFPANAPFVCAFDSIPRTCR